MAEKTSTKKQSFTLKRIPSTDKIFFVQNLAVLVKAGFSLANGLTTVAKQTKQKWFKEVIESVAQNVQSGQTFADALRQYEKLFDPLFINMIEAGEVSGKLELTLKELALQMKKSHTLFLKVRNALAYPTVILVAMLGIGTGMMIFVIPKITDLYKDTSFQLPLPTRIIITVSDFVLQNGIITAGIAVGAVALFLVLKKQPPVRLALHKLILHLPIAGKIVREFNVARFSRVFHSLITTDIPLIRSFQIITNTLGNQAYKSFLSSVIPQMERGISIGESLEQGGKLFPSTVVEMIKVAEASGALDQMTGDIAEHYEEEVSSTLDALSVLIEPVLMLVLGGGVGLIAIAVLWPMYSLVNVI